MAAALLCAAPAASEAPQTGKSRVALATVADPRNRPLLDVDPDDFVIQEGTAAREILSVHVADYPIIVMIDTGMAARADWSHMQKAVVRFIERIGQQRPVAIGTFGDTPKMITTFDDDRQVLMERVNALTPGATESLPVEGVALATRTLAPGSLFSAIVVVSAGTAGDERGQADALVPSIVTSSAILHVVTRTSSMAAGAGGVHRVLRSIAEQTRGHYTAIYTAASFQPALDQIAARLGSELMVEYLVPAESHASDVKVGVRIPGARVRGLGVAPR